MPLYACAKLFTRAQSSSYACETTGFHPDVFFVTRRYFFPYDRFTGYKKSNQNQSGRALPFAFALTCYKIYFLHSTLSDFDLFRWRLQLSDSVCRLRARAAKTLSSLLKKKLFIRDNYFLMSRWAISCVSNLKTNPNQPGSPAWMFNSGRPQTVGNWGVLMDTNSGNWHYFLFLSQRDFISVRWEDSLIKF